MIFCKSHSNIHSKFISIHGLFKKSKTQIDDGHQEPMANFKVGNFKLKICGQLHEAWTKVKAMKLIIIKGWDKIGITIAFLPSF
jgi:hypothetical protein